MKPSEKIIRSLLRIITPGEISELTKIASSRPRVALTEIMIREQYRENREEALSSEAISSDEVKENIPESLKDNNSKLVLKGGEELSRGAYLFFLKKIN